MNKRRLTLLATMLVTLVLGSVHAFSVLIVPLEQALQLPRSQISLIYSLALLALTFAVLLGYRVYPRLPAWWLLSATCGAAAIGLWLAANARDWWLLCAGYSLVFGFSNGIGYGYCLQLVGRVMPDIKGFAMGAVTAAYAVGSILFARLLAWRIETASLPAALLDVALIIAASGLLAALLLRVARVRWGVDVDSARGAALDRMRLLQFWCAYMTGVFSGLMAIGHAAGIAWSKQADTGLATLAAITIGVGSAGGGFIAGALADRWSLRRLLVGLPLLAALALVVIGVGDSARIAVAMLTLVGFSYGAIIALYPVAIADSFGAAGPRAYGRVFTAWGFAGLVAPWSAGLIYDARADYRLAMLIAAAIAVLSALAALSLRLEQPAERGSH